MTRMFAIVEREMRKFFRSPALMMVSMMLPLVQLVVLGNAFGGKIRNAKIGVVDYDHGSQALKIHEAFQSIAVNIRTFTTVDYDNEQQAREDVRTGKIDGAVIIPSQYSRRVLADDSPAIGLVVDNTDQTMSGALEQEMQSLVDALNAPQIQPLVVQSIALKIVELYPYVEYMKYLLSGSVALAMYVAVMIGGGMLYIDDKARGIHEGFLVTPITRLELVLGLNLAGTIKAVLSGITLALIGSLAAGLGVIFHPMIALQLFALIVATSVAFNGMMFLMMVRVEDPLVPRAMFGVLNTLLFFPSGAISPISGFPKWLKAIAICDPFTYAVHGLKAIFLKDGGWVAIRFDLAFLFGFGIVTLLVATPLFKRTL
ncbi:ABC transporter permease [Acidicapsa dinghuensis]|uniref:ABC transporter permease n=1 Tax=Acidicapsa dinghuensis TaxID=2218256 RepID=A0ABW1EMS9_9BACT|nr:ABC transporter permease [Acidicapsa dinghuensis]